MGWLPPTDGKSQEEAAAVVGVAQKTVDNWERGIISNIPENNTYTPLDLRIKVGKAEHHAKLFLLTSGRAGAGDKYPSREEYLYPDIRAHRD